MSKRKAETGEQTTLSFGSSSSNAGSETKDGGSAEKKRKTENESTTDLGPYVKTGTEADYDWKDPENKYPFIYKVELPVSRRGLFCEICQKGNKGGTWDKEPFKSVRISHVEKHVDSADHKKSVKAAGTQPSLAFGTKARDKDVVIWEALKAKFACLYWLAKEEVTSTCQRF
jgi:hypothetical protein